MADFDPKIYPSRMFIRFTAYKQLMADVTGHVTSVKMQRLGREVYIQHFIPGGEPTAQANDASASTESQGTPFSMTPERDLPATALTQNHPSPADVETHQPQHLDEPLFGEIVATVLTPKRHPELYQCFATTAAVAQIEAEIAAEIVVIYRQIKRNQTSPLIQTLNSLL